MVWSRAALAGDHRGRDRGVRGERCPVTRSGPDTDRRGHRGHCEPDQHGQHEPGSDGLPRSPSPAPTPSPARYPRRSPRRRSQRASRFDEGRVGDDPPSTEITQTVSWGAPLTEGVEIRVYGVTECVARPTNPSPDTSGPCLVEHTPLPASVRTLLATAPASDGEVSWSWTGTFDCEVGLAFDPRGPAYHAVVLAAYGASGHSIFAIAEPGGWWQPGPERHRLLISHRPHAGPPPAVASRRGRDRHVGSVEAIRTLGSADPSAVGPPGAGGPRARGSLDRGPRRRDLRLPRPERRGQVDDDPAPARLPPPERRRGVRPRARHRPPVGRDPPPDGLSAGRHRPLRHDVRRGPARLPRRPDRPAVDPPGASCATGSRCRRRRSAAWSATTRGACARRSGSSRPSSTIPSWRSSTSRPRASTRSCSERSTRSSTTSVPLAGRSSSRRTSCPRSSGSATGSRSSGADGSSRSRTSRRCLPAASGTSRCGSRARRRPSMASPASRASRSSPTGGSPATSRATSGRSWPRSATSASPT